MGLWPCDIYIHNIKGEIQMAAISRWVRYPIAGTTGFAAVQEGTRGLQRGTANTSDTFTIPGSVTNQMKVNIDGAAGPAPYQITLSSGTDLDPRFIARDIQRKIQAAGAGINDGFDYCQVEFSNYKSGNGFGQFVIRSGTTDTGSTVAITAGDSDVLSILGLQSLSTENGTPDRLGEAGTAAVDPAYTGTASVSGTYRGAFDDMYQLTIGQAQNVGTTANGGGNTYGVSNAGAAPAGGFWNGDVTDTYTVTMATTNGQTVGGGTGNVPTFTVTSTQADNIAVAQELLYSDEPYYIGTFGLTLSFTDAPFGSGDTFTIICTKQTTADGSTATAAVATAEYQYSSLLGDNSSAGIVTSVGGTALGRKGLTIGFSNSGVLTVSDEFKVVCKGPTPEAYGITNMVYGNVTVTTESALKAHQFEIMSGAVDMSSVKFSLQNDGTFSHHNAGDSDTYFRYGTAGFGKPGDGASNPNDGPEWTTSVSAADLATAKTSGNTGAPIHLDSTVPDLSVVSSADNAEDGGNRSMISDFIWTGIRLGAQESGANSSINYRLYFDFV